MNFSLKYHYQTSYQSWTLSTLVLFSIFHFYLSFMSWQDILTKAIIGHRSKVVFHQRWSSIKGRPPSKFVFHQRLSSIKWRLPSKVIIHQRLSSISFPPSNVVFYQRLSSIKALPPLEVFYHCCLLSKFVFHQRSSSFKGRLNLLYQCVLERSHSTHYSRNFSIS